tara:strand:- start:80 stop:1276 length:1197 start_codon:yes stop_codon:yes gene_type:complete
MLFKIIDRYIFKELFKLFIISTGALTTVLYLDKFLFMAQMIVNRGVSFMEMILMMAYLSPAFLALTIPMGVLFASVITFNQFSVNNEWVAMKACNWGFLELMKPVGCFAILTYILASSVMFWVLPWGNQSYKILIYDIIKNRANLDIKPNVFNKNFKNLILLVKDRDQNSTLHDVFIAKTNSTTDHPQIITSDEGVIYSNPEILKIQLKLNKGTIHELGKERTNYKILNFDKYNITLSLPENERLEKKALVGHTELSLEKLKEKMLDRRKKGLPTAGQEVEISKKFSLPFACLLFAFFGAPLGIKYSRSGKAGSFGVAVLVILIYYITFIMTQNLGSIGEIHAYTSVWIPNMFFLIIVIYSNYKIYKEEPIQILERINNLLITLYKSFRSLLAKNTRS